MFCEERGKRQGKNREAKERTFGLGYFSGPGLAVHGSLQGLALEEASSLTGCVGNQ